MAIIGKRPSEHVIAISGIAIKPYWRAYTTASSDSVTDAGAVVHVNGDDGYADVVCGTNASLDAVSTFYTALRTASALLPIVSTLYPAGTWFQCFSARIGLTTTFANTRADVHIFSSTSHLLDITLSIAPGASTLTAFENTVDINDVLKYISQTFTSSAVELDLLNFYVLARRTKAAMLGVRAEYEFKIVFEYAGTMYTILNIIKTVSTIDTYQTEFICTIT